MLLELVRFLVVFLERHLDRVERHENFPLNDLLSLLFRFSFSLPTPALFVEMLAVWNVFVQFVASGKCDGRRRPTYESGLLSLSGKLIERMLYSSCSTSLQFLSNLSDTPAITNQGRYGSANSPQKMSTTSNNTSSSSSFVSFNDNDSNTDDSSTTLWTVPISNKSELDEYIEKSIQLITTLAQIPGLVGQLLSTVVPALQSSATNYTTQGDIGARDLSTLCSIVSASSGYFVSSFNDTVRSTFQIYSVILEVSFNILTQRTWSKGHTTLALLLQTFKTLGTFSTFLGTCIKSQNNEISQNVGLLLERTAQLGESILNEGRCEQCMFGVVVGVGFIRVFLFLIVFSGHLQYF